VSCEKEKTMDSGGDERMGGGGGGGGGSGSGLPRLRADDMRVWDDDYGVCGGYLNKKASKSSAFSKGKWQKRWFFIKTESLKSDENYSLEYGYSPEDRSSRAIFKLEGASAVVSTGNSFQLNFSDGSNLIMSADSPELRDDWVAMLHAISVVAQLRGRAIRERQQYLEDDGVDGHVDEDGGHGRAYDGEDYENRTNRSDKRSVNPFQVRYKQNPQMRLDVDITSIPPSSTQRRQFEEMLVGDIAAALGISTEGIEVLSLKPCIGMDWLTVVEFDIVVYREHEVDEDGNIIEHDESVEEAMVEERRDLLWRLHEMVKDTSSPLYRGFITSKLDPSYTVGLSDHEPNDAAVEVYSADPKVLSVLNKYKDVVVPYNTIDTSHFKIMLQFEQREVEIEVPNPLVFPRRRHCAIWPFEIKQALGFWGTMQELWIEPASLVPVGLPRHMSHPIDFEPSARVGGAVAINAYRLKADLTYELVCDDFRSAVKESLTEEEYEQIEATFHQYDVDGNGTISKNELEQMIRKRVADRRELIEAKFIQVAGSGLTADELRQAEESKQQHLQQLSESQVKLVKMFEAADVNQDGQLTKEEFILAEAWWMHCTLNPEHAHLF
jgi:Ca2+-binding EF-hand superfamily protein